MNFTALHHQPFPLLIANVWDASSALVAQRAGYLALGTSSAAMAVMLGYDDGEGMSFEELFYLVSRIRAVTTLPLSVDLEAGYGDTAQEIASHIQRLAALGVVGVNLEDSRVVNGERRLDDAARFAGKLSAIREISGGMFLNVRTDTFLLGVDQPLEETLRRGRLYAAQGVDGFFVPCVTRPDDIAALVREIPLPLNVMCMPDLPGFDALGTLGVKRISMGNFVHAAMLTQLEESLVNVTSSQSFAGVFQP